MTEEQKCKILLPWDVLTEELEAFGSEELAGATGLEPAASYVTGVSNQLNYAHMGRLIHLIIVLSDAVWLLGHAAHKSGL